MNQELKFEKWCVPESGHGGSWLRSSVKWLRPGDKIRPLKEQVEEKDIAVYKVISYPFWSDAHRCWNVKLSVWEKI